MQGPVAYCTTSDGVRIAYSVTGTGHALLSIPGFLESFALDSIVSFSEEFYGKLGAGAAASEHPPLAFTHRAPLVRAVAVTLDALRRASSSRTC